jgi:hypothetical protein
MLKKFAYVNRISSSFDIIEMILIDFRNAYVKASSGLSKDNHIYTKLSQKRHFGSCVRRCFAAAKFRKIWHQKQLCLLSEGWNIAWR